MPVTNPTFPTVRWGDLTVTFETATEMPPREEVMAVVVFARYRDGFILADVPRGWCTPSGRLEPEETPLQAALRETREEIGATLENPRPIGRYVLVDAEGRTKYVPAYAGRVRQFGEIPPGSESRGAKYVRREALPTLYWHWDALLERMFEYAWTELTGGEAGRKR